MAMSLIQPSDRFFVAGARGMAGSAIVRALKRSGYGDPASGGNYSPRIDRSLICSMTERLFTDEQTKAGCSGAGRCHCGGIEANRTRPADFLLQNLRIETQVIETAWRVGVRRLLFLEAAASTQSSRHNR